MTKYYLLITLSFFAFSAQAQFVIQGSVIDAKSKLPLPGVNVVAHPSWDSTRMLGSITDLEGKFELVASRPGPYVVRLSFVGYVTRIEQIRLSRETAAADLGRLSLQEDVKNLGEVTIEGVQQRVVEKGDTTEINANAYQVNPDADAEQLVRKMPGITIENGQLQAQGEQVRRVLLDGQEFFGDDAMMALRNLPAEVIEKIQLIDQQSEQARFTGFNDGNTEKTLNIITKSGLDNSRFGKVYAGFGTGSRYMGGGNVNFFSGRKRVALVGMGNNINQQNFSSQDLGGLTGRGGGGRTGGNWRGRSDESANFLTGQQAGISATQAVGINYSDQWGAKGKMSASYFINRSDNQQENLLNRQFFLDDGIGQRYNEGNQSQIVSLNNRFSMRLEYNIDSNNSIIFSPRVSWQGRNQWTLLDGLTSDRLNNPINSMLNEQDRNDRNWNIHGDLQFRHRFAKKGRTISLNLNSDVNSQNGLRDLLSFNRQFGMNPDSVLIDQELQSASYAQRYRADLVFTEAAGKKGMFEFSYAPQWQISLSDQQANNFNPLNGGYDLIDSSISNRFDNQIFSQSWGTRYRYSEERFDWMIGTNYQISNMLSAQLFPQELEIGRNFYNWLPSAMFRYNFSRSANLRVFYRTNTQLPSLSQLQNVIDNTNTLQLRGGNPDLVQSYTHRLGARFRSSNAKKGTSFFVFAAMSLLSDEIANSTLIALRDTVLGPGLELVRGAQLIRPVNVAGAYNLRTFASWGFPVARLKSNVNLNAGYILNNTPSLINGVVNEALTHNINSGITLGSNISKELDFTLNYSLNYNLVFNSIQPQLNNDYYIHNAGIRFNWMPKPMLVISTDVMHSAFAGLEDGFNQQFTLLNAGVGYRFLKNRRAELRLSVFDLLGQNNSVLRNVTETYVEDRQTVVLQQFFMLTFTYNIRHFGKRAERSNGAGRS
ncbi:MAG: outer membrane beta-barrel protein [Bacteroidia bacterium]